MARCNKRGRSWRGSCNEKGYAGKERVATRKEYAGGGVATRRDMLEKSVLQRERNTLEELQREGICWKRACCNEKGIRWRSCNEKGYDGKERVATRKEYAGGGVATRRDTLEKSVLQRERNMLEEES